MDPRLHYLYDTLGYINMNQVRATGYFRLALIPYMKGDYEVALEFCDTAINLFDSHDINPRDHTLHWLMGLSNLEMGNVEKARFEASEMDSIIDDFHINEIKYQMKLLKFNLHLKVAIASYEGNLDEFIRILSIFDNVLYTKVKDHTSDFDLAYLNNSLGEILMGDNLNLVHLASERYNKAIDYNPNYALAHYNLWKCYTEVGDLDKAEEHKDRFAEIWAEADEELKVGLNI